MEIAEILNIEPRLNKVFLEAKNYNNLISWNTKVKIWSKEIKPQILKLVGFYSENEKLQSTEVYDKVYFRCIKLMGL